MPAQWLYETAARWDLELAAVQAVIEDPGTTVRLVAEPGPAAAEALRTARLGLAVQRLALDAVVANRLLPAETPDPWLAGLVAQQRKHLDELAEEFPVVREVAHLGRDPRGDDDLDAASASHPGRDDGPDPGSGPSRTGSPRTTSWCGACRCPAPSRTGSRWCGAATNSCSPSARSGASSALPSALRRCTVTGAAPARRRTARSASRPIPGCGPAVR